MTKPIIAIDIDDVLADYAAGFVAFSNARWGTNLTVDDYDEHWAKLWQVDIDEIARRADILHDERMIAGIAHREEALPVLEKLSDKYKLIIITSRRIQGKDDTIQWITKHYPMFDVKDINFAGFWDTITHEAIHKTKGELAAGLGVAYVIDDQLKHCKSAAELGISALLFGNYGWNKADSLPEGVTRVASWRDVGEYFGV